MNILRRKIEQWIRGIAYEVTVRQLSRVDGLEEIPKEELLKGAISFGKDFEPERTFRVRNLE